MIDFSHGIVADAKSGVSGAGKHATATTHFMNVAGNLSAYAVFGHRHTGEILDLMRGINEGTRSTFIFSTHDALVMERARRIVALHDGRIQSDTIADGARP